MCQICLFYLYPNLEKPQFHGHLFQVKRQYLLNVTNTYPNGYYHSQDMEEFWHFSAELPLSLLIVI